MSQAKYNSIIRHYEECFERHGDTHLGVDWPNELDAAKRYSVMLDVLRNPLDGMSLLDFGCGASHLYPILKKTFPSITYAGLDASQIFCDFSQKKYPENTYYCLDVIQQADQLPGFDFIVMNGVFTEKKGLNFDEMFDYFKQLLRIVFSKARVGIAFNVMSTFVDWERDDLFHLPLELVGTFLTRELNRHFVIRNDYGLYEYTVYVYKESCYG